MAEKIPYPEQTGENMESKSEEEKKQPPKKIYQDPKTGQVLTPGEWEERKMGNPDAQR